MIVLAVLLVVVIPTVILGWAAVKIGSDIDDAQDRDRQDRALAAARPHVDRLVEINDEIEHIIGVPPRTEDATGRDPEVPASTALTRTPGPSEQYGSSHPALTATQAWLEANPAFGSPIMRGLPHTLPGPINDVYDTASIVAACTVPDWVDTEPDQLEAIAAYTLLECASAELLLAAARLRRYCGTGEL